MPCLYLDFEYNRPAERHPELVCVALKAYPDLEKTEVKWLYKDARAKKALYNLLLEYRENHYTLVSYAATAEARCLYALGLDPTTFQWIDLYLEWRQLRNCKDKWNYGTYFTNNIPRRSVPPIYDRPHLNEGRDNTPVPYSLAGCTGRLLKKNIDKYVKKGMVDLILTAPEKFTTEEQHDIMEYCVSDLKYLPEIHEKMTAELIVALRTPREQVETLQAIRGQFSAHAAIMESTGIPLDMAACVNLRRNVDMAKDKLIRDLVDNHYPFFMRKKRTQGELLGAWTDKYSQFKSYVEDHLSESVLKSWKLTDSGRLCTDDEYLSNFDNIPAIYAYRQTRKLLNQLKWFREPGEGEGDLFDSIGSDGRLRCFFGIYGTQTARNAPQAKRFIFAMSQWLRCLVRAPEGFVITELDYGSQEFAIGAILSKDKNMIEAYASGDPYLWFAKEAGAVPPEGTKKTHEKERNLFKATTLGLQYGMGSKSLAIKLSSDMGETITETRAQKLIDLHKRTYRIYWRWLERVEQKYQRQGFLQLPCGWAMFGDNPQALSVRNFPTQGAGSSVIREAVRLLKNTGITAIATLHDSVYILTPENSLEPIHIARSCLEKAFDEILQQNELKIRIDVNSHPSGEIWVPEKGAKFYELLKEYLQPQETREDRIQKLMTGIFS